MTAPIRIRVGAWELHYDRDYGMSRRAGWSAAFDGHFVAELTTLGRALWALIQEAAR